MTVLSERLEELLSKLGVRTVETITTQRGPSFRGSLVSAEASEITAKARERHFADGYGFWENTVSLATSASDATRQGIFEGAITQNPMPAEHEQLALEQFCRKLASGAWQGLPGRRLVSLSSRMWTEAGQAHLQMLDLSVPANSEHAVQTVRDAAGVLGVKGILVKTGRSFHLYGDVILEWDEYVQFLARAALLAPVVDSRWVLHQILDGQASLRVSNNLERDQSMPEPVEVL